MQALKQHSFVRSFIHSFVRHVFVRLSRKFFVDAENIRRREKFFDCAKNLEILGPVDAIDFVGNSLTWPWQNRKVIFLQKGCWYWTSTEPGWRSPESGPAAFSYRIQDFFGRTDLWRRLSTAKFDEQSDFEVHFSVAPQKPRQISEKQSF